MDMLQWAKEHPWMAGALTLGAVFILLWLLGFFGSSSSSSSSSSGTNLAAAYYNAEAAQTTAGTQLQMATEAYAAQTAQDQIQANAATGIATTQANMYTTIGGQNAGVETALGNDQLLASNNANDDAQATALGEANFAYQTAQAGYTAASLQTAMNTIIPQEIAFGGGTTQIGIPGVGTYSADLGAPSPNDLAAMGYSPLGIAQALNLPYPGYTATG